MDRKFRIMYRVVAPYNNSVAPVWFKTRKGANNYVSQNSIKTIPFDPRCLAVETRPRFNVD